MIKPREDGAENVIEIDGVSRQFGRVQALDDVTGAHIHSGAAGTDGPVLATLFGPHTGLDADGVLSRGTVDAGHVSARLCQPSYSSKRSALMERM